MPWRPIAKGSAHRVAVRLSLLVVIGCGAGCGGGSGSGTVAAPVVAPATSTRPPDATVTATVVPIFTGTAAPVVVPSSTSTVLPPLATPTFSFTPTATVTMAIEPTAPVPTETVAPTLTPSTQPTPMTTATPESGPIVTAFGLADVNGTFIRSSDSDSAGRPIFVHQGGAGFVIFIEGRPGLSRLRVGTDLLKSTAGDAANQPDLQVESTHNLGDGSATVCDKNLPAPGGVPGIDPPDFSQIQAVSDALNDLSCRFKSFVETDFACTQDRDGNFIFGNPISTVQFCALVNNSLTFPVGDTVLTARLLDRAGQAGSQVQIVVRILAKQ